MKLRAFARVCEDLCIAGHDEPRLLHRRSEYGYTRTVTVALLLEPEAVSADAQWLITREAANRELHTWLTSRQRLLDEIDHLRVHLHNPHVDRAARAFLREIDALDRKLTG